MQVSKEELANVTSGELLQLGVILVCELSFRTPKVEALISSAKISPRVSSAIAEYHRLLWAFISPMMIVSSLASRCEILATKDGGQQVVGGMYRLMRVISVEPEITTIACCSRVFVLSFGRGMLTSLYWILLLIKKTRPPPCLPERSFLTQE